MYQKTSLPNGVRVVTEYIPHVRSVSIGFWLRTGARDEPPELNGISHFIEHMVFKGTATRSARLIAETIDAAGGQLNAFTSKEHTCYYARVLDEHFELAVDVLSDMLLHSELAPTELEKEKGVVLEEIRMYEDSPDESVHDLFASAVLVGHPLAQNVLGSEETVQALGRNDLVSYMRRFYTANNLVVAAAGNVSHDQVVASVASHLGALHAGSDSRVPTPCVTKGRNQIRRKETEQVHICIGSPGYKETSDAKYALNVLDMAVGGGMSSRLFQELREERGLVYATYSYHSLFQDAGLFTVYAGTSPRNVRQVLDLVGDEFSKVVDSGLNDEELRRAKEQLKGSLMLSLESTANRMNRLAKAELFEEEVLSPDQLIARIDQVTPADVAEVAAKLLDPRAQVVAAVGPVSEDVVSLEEVL